MGLFWDLLQHSQISDQKARTGSLEHRVENLETELRDTQRLLHDTLQRLEKHVGVDLDGDGRIAR